MYLSAMHLGLSSSSRRLVVGCSLLLDICSGAVKSSGIELDLVSNHSSLFPLSGTANPRLYFRGLEYIPTECLVFSPLPIFIVLLPLGIAAWSRSRLRDVSKFWMHVRLRLSVM